MPDTRTLVIVLIAILSLITVVSCYDSLSDPAARAGFTGIIVSNAMTISVVVLVLPFFAIDWFVSRLVRRVVFFVIPEDWHAAATIVLALAALVGLAWFVASYITWQSSFNPPIPPNTQMEVEWVLLVEAVFVDVWNLCLVSFLPFSLFAVGIGFSSPQDA